MNITTIVKLRGALQKATVTKEIEQAIQAGSYIVEGFYKKEVPVNKGDLRSSVATRKINAGFKVAPWLDEMYPLYVHEGTGRYAGHSDYGYTSGYTRKNMPYGQKDKKSATVLMMILAKKKLLKGIKPNKYADRARAGSWGKLMAFYLNNLVPLIDR